MGVRKSTAGARSRAMVKAAAGVAVAAMIAVPLAAIPYAEAHTPYLLPTVFAVSKDHVTLQAALSEDEYFVPDFPLRNMDYFVVDPTGARTKVETVTMLKDFAAIEVPIQGKGTYRLTTGDKPARTLKMAKIDGRWLMVRPAGSPARGGPPAEGPPRFVEEAAVPAGTQTMESHTYIRSETYVTKGAPSNGVLKASAKGFDVLPLMNPNELFLDTGFAFQVTNDGKPVKDLHFSVFRGGNSYDEKKVTAEAKSDHDGKVKLSFTRPGVYMVTASYPPRPSGPGAEPVPESWIYSLTFEVTQ